VPAYTNQAERGHNYLRYAVFMGTENPLFNHSMIRQTFAFLQQRIECDVARKWNTNVLFYFFTHDNQPTNWNDYIPIFIVDELTVSCGCSSYFGYGSVTGAFAGAPTTLLLETPYILIVIGDGSGDGVISMYNSRHVLYGETLTSSFSMAVGVPLLNQMGSFYFQNFAFFFNLDTFTLDFYVLFIADPYSFGPGYTTDGGTFTFPDFALQPYFNGYLAGFSSGPGPFDFSGLSPNAGIPYQGFQQFIRVNTTSGDTLFCYLTSPQPAPGALLESCYIVTVPLSVESADAGYISDLIRGMPHIYALPSSPVDKRFVDSTMA
jgi:hypothetical protein